LTSEDGLSRFFFAGVLAGFAWMTRETAAGLMLFYGILFLLGVGGSRRSYVWIGLGFCLVAGTELLWYWAQTGDPLYRLWIDLDQGHSKGAHLMSRPIDSQFKTYRLQSPFVAILLNQNFALLFYFVLPASVWALRDRQLAPGQRRLVLLLMGLMVCWFTTIGYVIPLRSMARYFEVSAAAGALLVGVWIAVGIEGRSRLLAIAAAVAVVGTNLAGIYIDNRSPAFGERAAVEWARRHQEPIYTDGGTAGRADFLAKVGGINGFVRSGSPPPGGAFLNNPNSPGGDKTPPNGWPEVERFAPGRKWSGYLAEAIRLDRLLPPWIVRKLNSPNQPVVVVRRPLAANAPAPLPPSP
jgi:hypothetical protein